MTGKRLESESSFKSTIIKIPPYKRVLDISILLLAHIMLLPLWIILWFIIPVAIWFNDKGPIFFEDERVGRDGKRFKVYKFRSMVVDADNGLGPKQAEENDRRITRVGKILRATALDELPQLINILKGDMSFVGPRALRQDEIELNGYFRNIEEVPGYWLRVQVCPGLTGIAQIYAPRDINRRNKFRYDAIYVRNINFWLDLKLIALSVWITLMGKWEIRNNKVEIRLKKGWVKRVERRIECEETIFSKKLIGQILLEAGLINEKQLEEVLEYQKLKGGKIGENLIRRKYISQVALHYYLNQQLEN